MILPTGKDQTDLFSGFPEPALEFLFPSFVGLVGVYKYDTQEGSQTSWIKTSSTTQEPRYRTMTGAAV